MIIKSDVLKVLANYDNYLGNKEFNDDNIIVKDVKINEDGEVRVTYNFEENNEENAFSINVDELKFFHKKNITVDEFAEFFLHGELYNGELKDSYAEDLLLINEHLNMFSKELELFLKLN